MQQIKAPKVPLRKASGTFNYKITIPQNVEQKIRYLLEKIHNIEWSGKLFFDYKGTFENNDLEIICRDIFLMDIGNSTYTEFDDGDFGNYMLTHGLLKCKIGLIHSHHSFSTFFSGEDQHTLLKEGSDLNNFVSLIVNNAGAYSAAITRKVAIKRNIQDEVCQPFFGEGAKTMSKSSKEEDVQYVEWFDLKVEKELSKAFTEIDERIVQVKEIKAQKAKEEANKVSVQPSWADKNPQSYGNAYALDYGRNYGGSYGSYDSASFWDNPPVSAQNNQTPQPLNPKESWNTQKPATPSTVQNSIKDEGDEIETALLEFVKNNLREEGINQLAYKLITGSIVASKLDEKSLSTWKKLMVTTYDRTFKGLGDFEEFSNWYVEFIIERVSWELFQKLDTNADEFKNVLIDEEDISSIVARLVCDKLEDFPQNPYIEGYINALLNMFIK